MVGVELQIGARRQSDENVAVPQVPFDPCPVAARSQRRVLAAMLWLIFTVFPAAVGTVLQIHDIDAQGGRRLRRACCWLA
jgi:hypothetical protein